MSKKRQSYHSQKAQTAPRTAPAPSKDTPSRKGRSLLSSASNASTWWIALIPAAAVLLAVILALSPYPHSEMMMEKINFFVWTPDFINAAMAFYPGLNMLTETWMLQYFGNPTTGIVIEAILLAIVTLLAALVPCCWRFKSNYLFGLIPSLGLAWMFTHHISLSFEGIWFFCALCATGLAWRSRRQWISTIAIVIISLLSMWMVSFPVNVMLNVIISALLAYRTLRRDKTQTTAPTLSAMPLINIALPLLFVALTACFVSYYSSSVKFIPLDCRWWYTRNVGDKEFIYLILYALPIALMLIPRIGGRILQAAITIATSLAACFFYYSHLADNEGYHTTENVYTYADLAEEARWEDLLSEIDNRGAITDNVTLQFALLAEARMGTLAENLFSYQINSAETFCPRLDNTPLSIDFCRIFYRELGFYDEAYHQTFQYGMRYSQNYGFCTSGLRHMAEYCVKLGDRPAAEKYLSLLEKTSCNTDFVAEQRSLLKDAKPMPAELRCRTFIKSMAFNSEMAYFLDENRDLKPALDYLLCGLLLSKNLEHFKIIINDFANTYEGRPLPRAYAEAASMINHIMPGLLDPRLTYDPQLDRSFEDFIQRHNTKQDDSQYMGTFWYYYTYAQIPPPQAWQQSSAGATS